MTDTNIDNIIPLEGDARWLNDGFINMLAGLGVVGRDKFASQTYVYSQLSVLELETAYRSDWIARKVVQIPALDMTREWRSWQADPDQITLLEETEKKLLVQSKLQQALIRSRLYGGAVIIIGVDAGKPEEELDPETVTKDSLKFLHVVSRNNITAGPLVYDISSKYFGQPEYYEARNQPASKSFQQAEPANATFGTQSNVRLHPSRVVKLIGMETADQMISNIWGDSVLQPVNDAIKMCGLVTGSLATLMSELKIDVIKIPELKSILSTQAGERKMIARFQAANAAKSVVNTILIDGNEEWQRIQTTFAGIPEVIQTYMQMASGAADIPATRFLGMSPRGLNATGESDIRNYYDRLSAEQSTILTPTMTVLDEVLIRSALGERPPEVWYDWKTLWQLNATEKATIALQKSQAYKIDVDAAQIPTTVLANARANQLIEDGVYPGLEKELEEAALEGDTIEEHNTAPSMDPLMEAQKTMAEAGVVQPPVAPAGGNVIPLKGKKPNPFGGGDSVPLDDDEDDDDDDDDEFSDFNENHDPDTGEFTGSGEGGGGGNGKGEGDKPSSEEQAKANKEEAEKRAARESGGKSAEGGKGESGRNASGGSTGGGGGKGGGAGKEAKGEGKGAGKEGKAEKAKGEKAAKHHEKAAKEHQKEAKANAKAEAKMAKAEAASAKAEAKAKAKAEAEAKKGGGGSGGKAKKEGKFTSKYSKPKESGGGGGGGGGKGGGGKAKAGGSKGSKAAPKPKAAAKQPAKRPSAGPKIAPGTKFTRKEYEALKARVEAERKRRRDSAPDLFDINECHDPQTGKFCAEGGGPGGAPGREREAVPGYKTGEHAAGDAKDIKDTKADWYDKNPHRDIPSAINGAKDAQERLGPIGDKIAKEHGADWKDPGIKTDMNRIQEKADERKGINNVSDLYRGGFNIDRPEQADKIAKDLADHYGTANEKFRTTPEGYTDKAVSIRDKNGMVGEIQIVEKGMARAKADVEKGGGGGHQMYKEAQKLDQSIREGKSSNPTRDRARVNELKQKQRDLYGGVLNSYGKDWNKKIGR